MNYSNQLKYFENLLKKAEEQANSSPNINLRFSVSHNTYQYYYIDTSGKRRYIEKQNIDLVKKLAQKIYGKKILKELKTQVKLLEYFTKRYKPNIIREVYEKQSKAIKEFIQPYEQNYEEYGKLWNSKVYKTKPSGDTLTQFLTDNGDMVRSKSEVLIANKLKSAGLFYRYECQRYLKGMGFIYPDFLILHPQTKTEVIWEHFGMMDNPEYANNCVKKIYSYTLNGYIIGQNLICTFESLERPLDVNYLNTIIRQNFLSDI